MIVVVMGLAAGKLPALAYAGKLWPREKKKKKKGQKWIPALSRGQTKIWDIFNRSPLVSPFSLFYPHSAESGIHLTLTFPAAHKKPRPLANRGFLQAVRLEGLRLPLHLTFQLRIASNRSATRRP